MCTKGLDWEKLGIQKKIGHDFFKAPLKVEETREGDKHVVSNEDRWLSSIGYKVTAVLHYDDDFKSKFGEEADTRIDAIMALVDEQFDEAKVKLIQYLPPIVANPSAFFIN